MKGARKILNNPTMTLSRQHYRLQSFRLGSVFFRGFVKCADCWHILVNFMGIGIFFFSFSDCFNVMCGGNKSAISVNFGCVLLL